MPTLVYGRLLTALLVGLKPLAFNAADCIKENRPTFLSALLQAGLDPNTMHGDDPLLHRAVEASSAGCVEVLMKAGASLTLKNATGKTALVLAEKKKKPAVLRALNASKTGARLDLTRLTAASVDAQKLTFWSSLFGESATVSDVASLISEAQRFGAEEWSELLDGPLRSKAAWAHLALATAVQKLGVKGPSPKKVGTEALFSPSSLRLKGPLVLSAPLVVAGDLSVDGAIIDDDTAGWLVVSGSVTAEVIMTENQLLIGGDCTVRQFVWGDYNDHVLSIDGALSTPLLITTDHATEIGDERKVKEHLDGAPPSERFVKGALEKGAVSREKVKKLVRAGKPALRATPAS